MPSLKTKPRTILENQFGQIDKLDGQIIQLLLKGKNSKSIATNLKSPLSTVQRRIRKLFEHHLIVSTVDLNYEKLGYKRGMLHLYLSNGHVNEVGQVLAEMPGTDRGNPAVLERQLGEIATDPCAAQVDDQAFRGGQ